MPPPLNLAEFTAFSSSCAWTYSRWLFLHADGGKGSFQSYKAETGQAVGLGRQGALQSGANEVSSAVYCLWGCSVLFTCFQSNDEAAAGVNHHFHYHYIWPRSRQEMQFELGFASSSCVFFISLGIMEAKTRWLAALPLVLSHGGKLSWHSLCLQKFLCTLWCFPDHESTVARQFLFIYYFY